ncbi:MAG: phosphatidate cytidylyltransferase [Vallitalea sp.]|nr:phosphatidate cytidylyltransferase [Vallitalea sp.]
MKTRIISSIIALPILLVPLIFGGNILTLILFLVSILGLYEFYRAYKVNSLIYKSIGYIAAVSYYCILIIDKSEYLQEFFGIFFLILLIIYVFMYPRYNLKDIMIIFIGFFYVVYLLSYIMLVRNNELYGAWLVWLIFIVAFGSDTVAYFVGITFGKHKLAVKLSPKKSIEGSIGGIVGAIILSVIYGCILLKIGKLSDTIILISFAVIGGVGSILGQIGDLAASGMKRQTSIKDFGTIMPGHGGILDRLDSIIFTAPFVYYIMKFFII